MESDGGTSAISVASGNGCAEGRRRRGPTLQAHRTRHTWAIFALAAGKSVRWVADQLGHADPALTLRVYAHAIQDEESDLSFANFGDSKRLYPAPAELAETAKRHNTAKSLVGRQGLEPWTIGLKARCSTN